MQTLTPRTRTRNTFTELQLEGGSLNPLVESSQDESLLFNSHPSSENSKDRILLFTPPSQWTAGSPTPGTGKSPTPQATENHGDHSPTPPPPSNEVCESLGTPLTRDAIPDTSAQPSQTSRPCPQPPPLLSLRSSLPQRADRTQCWCSPESPPTSCNVNAVSQAASSQTGEPVASTGECMKLNARKTANLEYLRKQLTKLS